MLHNNYFVYGEKAYIFSVETFYVLNTLKFVFKLIKTIVKAINLWLILRIRKFGSTYNVFNIFYHT